MKKCILFALILFYSHVANSQQVIINSSISAAKLTQSQLRSIFSMRMRTWEDGKPIKVYVLSSDNELHRKFCSTQLDVFPYQLQRIWDVMLFSGTGEVPMVVKDETAMYEIIASTPGAIGYVSEIKEGALSVKAIQIH